MKKETVMHKNDNGGGDFAKCSIKIVKVVKCCAIL